MELETLKKYRTSITDILSSIKYVKKGEGIKYNQTKRNAYKIKKTGEYGNLKIDLPKLMSRLMLVAYKDGQRVCNKRVDFDTLDLFTKRFNSKKKYSDLSKKVFNEINQLSEIPIHKTSKKFDQGVVYFNNPNDLSSKMELIVVKLKRVTTTKN